jgi:ferredoxin
MGKPRVGCIFCPFSSPWDDMVVNNRFKANLSPFLNRIITIAKERKIPNLDEYVKERKWRLRASGNFVSQKSSVEFLKSTPHLVASISNAKNDIEKWLITISDFTISRNGNVAHGEFNFKKKIYAFEINYKDDSNYTFTLYNASDIMLVKALKRVLYKTTYCICCEVCEVECPTGALSVYPDIKIDKTKCTHCHNCLDFHEHGCVVADSLVKSMENKTKAGNISKYGTFGIREEWLAEFFADPQVTFWIVGNSSLGNKQVPSFKAWLKDAEIIDSKNVLTEFGQFCFDNMVNDPELIWSLIWINIVYNSELVGWFANNVKPNHAFDRASLSELAYDYFSSSFSKNTIDYAFQALMQVFNYSPCGETLCQGAEYDKNHLIRHEFKELSEIALAYSLYKFSEANGTTSLRVKDFYDEDCKNGIVREFCLSKETFEKGLRTLNSAKDRILVANLSMGLNHITLQDGLTPLDVLKKLF